MRSLLGPLALLALSLPGTLGALDPAIRLTQYVHDRWTTDEGLPQSSVMAIAQSRDGFLWIGTQEGFVRFDGLRFEGLDDEASMLGAHVLALLAGRDGAIWIGTDAGLARLPDSRLDGARVARWTHRDGLPDGAIYALAEAADGTVWIGTHNGLYRRQEERFDQVDFGLEAGEPIYSLLVDRDGTLWVGTAARGLWRLVDGGASRPTAAVGPANASIYKLAQDSEGRIWAATRGTGVIVVDGSRWRRLGARDGLPSDDLTAIGVDSQNNLWYGFADGSLARSAGDALDTLDGTRRLTELEIAVLFEDREGALWIGADGGGLHRLRSGALVPWGVPEGLADDTVLVALGARDGSLWIGTELGGLSRLVDGRFDNVSASLPGRRHAVLSLFEGADGTLWFGTKGGGLCRRQGAGPPRCEAVGRSLARGSVSAILETRTRELLVGTPLGVFRRVDGGYAPQGPEASLGAAYVLMLFEDRTGRVWAGTYGGGLWRRDEPTGEWSAVSLPGDLSVTAMLEDDDGTLWAGTAGGGLLRLRDERWNLFTRRDGLPDNTIYAIVDGGADSLWLSGNRGVVQIARAELAGDPGAHRLAARLLGRADGARSGECNGGTQPAAARTRDGRIWFPTLRGLAAFDPSRSDRLPPPAAPVVTALLADGRVLPLDREIRVPPGTRRIEFRYSSPTLSDPERVRFRHRLEPYDAEWIDAATRRDVAYGALPPGRYRFEVASHREGHDTTSDVSELELVVVPTLAQTTPFRVLAGVTLALAVLAAYRWRVLRLEASRRELARLVEVRTEELARVNRRLESANESLRRMTVTDALTGLSNRRHFDETLQSEWQRALRYGEPTALILADVDAFKAFNDLYGHPAGDDCLRRVAGVIADGARRAGELAARLGGEEFALLLPRTELPVALAAAESLRAAVEALAIPHSGASAASCVTASFGVAARVPSAPDAFVALVAEADRALYAAKQGGRNRVAPAR